LQNILAKFFLSVRHERTSQGAAVPPGKAIIFGKR